ncbi:hypothetical protein [Micromonospora sp. WMMD987]|uniref:effector-associated constant component EACC1 n=1 Tax=Micromonospora sp. WMMD987 TaxID=3016089 RepID=UPI00249C224D|nr:hypothetical protein [Micromonospora sp. WMMD987]WFE97526.1 hypothetical protein O7612_11930 [Micromonospora sp. WMMD987]
MPTTITIDSTEPEIFALADWCRRDDTLRTARIAPVSNRAAEPGAMGLLSDSLQVVSDHEALLTAVATTVGVWLGTRHRRTRIRVRHGERSVEIDTGHLKDPEKIASFITRQLDPARDADKD